MDFIKTFKNKIFSVNANNFEELALELFRFQAERVPVYNQYIQYLCLKPNEIERIEDIPFLPVSFFKNHKVLLKNTTSELYFTSSGTTKSEPSLHYLPDPDLYKKSILESFSRFWGRPEDYVFLALLPNYSEQQNSSLIYMVRELIGKSASNEGGFFLYNHEELYQKLLEQTVRKIFFIGVSYALLDFAHRYPVELPGAVVMETGGMKGRGKELPREELHEILTRKLGVGKIQSEYGMTELLSQAYSFGNGLFKTPPWMRVLIRDQYDPFSYVQSASSGGINVIDLANLYSCAFIETRDLGRMHLDGRFEVLGRMDNSELRGCNLML